MVNSVVQRDEPRVTLRNVRRGYRLLMPWDAGVRVRGPLGSSGSIKAAGRDTCFCVSLPCEDGNQSPMKTTIYGLARPDRTSV